MHAVFVPAKIAPEYLLFGGAAAISLLAFAALILVPAIGSYGRTWEKGGFVPHLRAILDDNGRPMVLINWNTDMGDGVEWSNAEEYPGYIKYTADSYRMFINEIIYSLTH